MPERRYSRQREQILKYVRSTKTHPTAEMVFEALKDEIPQLSLATVYRNLKLLTSDGSIVRIPLPIERYDATLDEHSHFWCRECNRVLDLDLDETSRRLREEAEESEHRIDRVEIMFTGICSECERGMKHEAI